ncbi:MAG: V-type ATP synthase subunit E family protein [Spirochaetia bacterium]|nr:V-type ATP synthase subunit E family protein [Spirochaetia bacterium]
MPEKSKESQNTSLLSGISEQVEAEVKKISEDAERQAKEIVEGGRKKAESIRRDAEEKGRKQAEGILKKNAQAIEAEQRKLLLKAQEELFSKAMGRVKEKLQALTERSDYRSILKGWIVEGAIGLAEDALKVNASEQELELITDGLLREAEAEVKSMTGRSVKIERTDQPPLQKQGVILTAREGRLAFNNTAEARLDRYSTVIRRMIYQRMEPSDE